MALSLYQMAERAARERNVPVGLIQAHLAHESAWGSSRLAKEDHNYAGITSTDGDYMHFDSDEDFIDYYTNFMGKWGIDGVSDPATFVHTLKHQQDGTSYFGDTEENYLNGVSSAFDQVGYEGSEGQGSTGVPDEEDDLPSDMLDARYIASNHPEDDELTNISRMQPISIHGANMIGKWATENGMSAILTGGAERGVHAPGEYSHESGWKADIVFNGSVTGGTAGGDEFIKFCHSNGWSVNWEGDHWDIDFSGHDSRDQQAGDHSRLKGLPSGDFMMDWMAAGMQGKMLNQWAPMLPQNDPAMGSPNAGEPKSVWQMMGQNFWDEFSSTGAASVVKYIWGIGTGSDIGFGNDFGKPYVLTQDDFDYVKKSLPGNKDAQRFILYNAKDQKHLQYLVNQKLEEQQRANDLERWRQQNYLNLQDIAVRVAGGAGAVLDPINLIPLGEAVAATKLATRLGTAITNVGKAKMIASYAAKMGARQVALNATDDALRANFGNQQPNYALNAVMAFAGGTISGLIGGVRAASKVSAQMNKVRRNAEKLEEVGMMEAADALTPDDVVRISTETYKEAIKRHNKDWAAKARKKSSVFASLEDNERIVAMTKAEAKDLVKKLSDKEIPDTANAFYVPNEDYFVVLTDGTKVAKNLDRVLGHEMLHGGLKETLGDRAYNELTGSIKKQLKNPKSNAFKAAQKAGSLDPEEVLGIMLEEGTLPRDNKWLQRSINKKLEQLGFSKNTLTLEDAKEIIKEQLTKKSKSYGGVHFNPDGSTSFAGIQFSKDNVMNPANWGLMMDYEDPATLRSITEANTPSGLKRVASGIEEAADTVYSRGQRSPSSAERNLAARLWDDPRGRGIGNMGAAMPAESQKRLILRQISAPYLDYLDMRSEYIGKLKNLTSNKARADFDEMVVRYYDAVYGKHTAGFVMDGIPEQVKKAAESLHKQREMIIDIGKRTATDMGTADRLKNFIDPDWNPVDHAFYRQIDRKKWMEFTSNFMGSKDDVTKEIKDVFREYINKYAQHDIIKDKIARNNGLKARGLDEEALKLFKQTHPMTSADVTDEMVTKWINSHTEETLKWWMGGPVDLNEFNHMTGKATYDLGSFKNRVPVDTSGILKYKGADGMLHEFSFDNNMRSFDVDHIIGSQATRFSGEAALSAHFKPGEIQKILKKMKGELTAAEQGGKIRSASNRLRDAIGAIQELRGMRDPMKRSGETFEGLSHLFRNAAYMKNGANMGFNQLAETAGTMAYGGAGQLFHVFKPLGEFVDGLRYGKKFAKEIAEDIEPMLFGRDISRNIWGRKFTDEYVEHIFKGNGVFDSSMRTVGNLIDRGSRVTSTMNALSKTTDNMVRGMRTQMIIDSMRAANGKWSKFLTARNPFSKAKLKAAHINPEEWKAILGKLKQFTIFDKGGRMAGLDHIGWRSADPVSFAKWQYWVEQAADRAVVPGTTIGGRSILKSKNALTQMLFQFKDYNLRSIHGQTLRALSARDLDDGMAAAMGVLTNTAVYASRAALLAGTYSALGMKEKAQKIRDTMLSDDNLIRAAVTRSAILGSPASFMNDWYEALFNVSSLRTTVNQNVDDSDFSSQMKHISSPQDVAGRIVTQLPAVKESLTGPVAIYTALTKGGNMNDRDAKKILQALPLNNFFAFTALTDKLLQDANIPKAKSKRRRSSY